MTETDSTRNRVRLAWGLALVASAVLFPVVSLWTNPLDAPAVAVAVGLCAGSR